MNAAATVRKCGLYVRVSTSQQSDVKDGSLDTQESLLRRFVEQNNLEGSELWEVVKVYREEGLSAGRADNRPRLQELLRDIAEHSINTVVFTKLDRICRSSGDWHRLCAFFATNGCKFISMSESFGSTGPVGTFTETLLVAFGQLEREIIATRIREKAAWRASEGLWNGGKPRLGYDLDPENTGVMKVNEAERVVVEEAFKTYLRCGSIRETTRLLNSAGWRTKSYRSRRGITRGGMPFTKSCVQRLLTDGVVVGKMQHNGEWKQAKHQPIIEPALFEEVQQLLARNGVVRPRRRQQQKQVFLLEGLLKCRCGARLTPTWSRNRWGTSYRYYECRRYRDEKSCDAGRVSADQIENIIAGRLVSLCEDPVLLEHVITEANASSSDQVRAANDKVLAMRDHVARVEKQIANLVDFLANGGNSPSVKEKLSGLEQQKRSLAAQLEEARQHLKQAQEKDVALDTTSTTLRFFNDAYAESSLEQKKRLFQLLVDEAVLEQDCIRLALYKIDSLSENDRSPVTTEGARERPIWWTEGDSNP
jgi:site-specific DNA recombinase